MVPVFCDVNLDCLFAWRSQIVTVCSHLNVLRQIIVFVMLACEQMTPPILGSHFNEKNGQSNMSSAAN